MVEIGWPYGTTYATRLRIRKLVLRSPDEYNRIRLCAVHRERRIQVDFNNGWRKLDTPYSYAQ